MASNFLRNIIPRKSLEPTVQSQREAIFGYVDEALKMAAESAKARGADKFTMTDYFIAANKLGEDKKEEMAKQKVEWTPKIIANLSKHRIEHAQINKVEIEPTQDMRQLAILNAAIKAREEGRDKATLGETLEQLQKIILSGEKVSSEKTLEKAKAHGIESMKDIADLDGDGIFNKFYDAVGAHNNFEGTIFDNVNFHPAGTLMPSGENRIARTDGAIFKNVTFDGLQDGDDVSFVGKFENVAFVNIKGGTIHIPDGTQVDGINIRGAHAAMEIGKAFINKLDATGAHIIVLNAAPEAEISHSTFDGSTIAMPSKLQRTKWNDVTFRNANLVDVDLSNARLTGVTFDSTDIKRTNFRSATLDNVSFKGINIQDLNLEGAEIRENVVINGRNYNTVQEFKLAQQMASAGVTSFLWKDEYKGMPASSQSPTPAQAAQIAQALVPNQIFDIGAVSNIAEVAKQQQIAETIATKISGGESVTGDITLAANRVIAEMERTVALEDQARGSNMNRDRGTSQA